MSIEMSVIMMLQEIYTAPNQQRD